MLNNCLLTGNLGADPIRFTYLESNLTKFHMAIGNLRKGERATYRLSHLEKRMDDPFLPTYWEDTQNGFK